MRLEVHRQFPGEAFLDVQKDRRELLPSVTLQQLLNRIRTVWQQIGKNLNANCFAVDKRPIQIEYDAYVCHCPNPTRQLKFETP